MNNTREKTLNVGCMGQFVLRYLVDCDEWNITFNNQDGTQYMTTSSNEIAGEFTNTSNFRDTLFVPDWMWNSFIDGIDMLRTEVEHDSIHTPYAVGTA